MKFSELSLQQTMKERDINIRAAFSCAGACWHLAGDAFISEQGPAGAGTTER